MTNISRTLKRHMGYRLTRRILKILFSAVLIITAMSFLNIPVLAKTKTSVVPEGKTVNATTVKAFMDAVKDPEVSTVTLKTKEKSKITLNVDTVTDYTWKMAYGYGRSVTKTQAKNIRIDAANCEVVMGDNDRDAECRLSGLTEITCKKLEVHHPQRKYDDIHAINVYGKKLELVIHDVTENVTLNIYSKKVDVTLDMPDTPLTSYNGGAFVLDFKYAGNYIFRASNENIRGNQYAESPKIILEKKSTLKLKGDGIQTGASAKENYEAGRACRFLVVLPRIIVKAAGTKIDTEFNVNIETTKNMTLVTRNYARMVTVIKKSKNKVTCKSMNNYRVRVVNGGTVKDNVGMTWYGDVKKEGETLLEAFYRIDRGIVYEEKWLKFEDLLGPELTDGEIVSDFGRCAEKGKYYALQGKYDRTFDYMGYLIKRYYRTLEELNEDDYDLLSVIDAYNSLDKDNDGFVNESDMIKVTVKDMTEVMTKIYNALEEKREVAFYIPIEEGNKFDYSGLAGVGIYGRGDNTDGWMNINNPYYQYLNREFKKVHPEGMGFSFTFYRGYDYEYYPHDNAKTPSDLMNNLYKGQTGDNLTYSMGMNSILYDASTGKPVGYIFFITDQDIVAYHKAKLIKERAMYTYRLIAELAPMFARVGNLTELGFMGTDDTFIPLVRNLAALEFGEMSDTQRVVLIENGFLNFGDAYNHIANFLGKPELLLYKDDCYGYGKKYIRNRIGDNMTIYAEHMMGGCCADCAAWTQIIYNLLGVECYQIDYDGEGFDGNGDPIRGHAFNAIHAYNGDGKEMWINYDWDLNALNGDELDGYETGTAWGHIDPYYSDCCIDSETGLAWGTIPLYKMFKEEEFFR